MTENSDREQRRGPPPPADGELPESFMELVLEFQTVTGMEDMAESRRILEANDWDLLNAISRHMGFEQIPERVSHFSQNQPSTSSGNRPPPPVQDESGPLQRNRIHGVQNGNESGDNNPGLLRWVWRLITAPVDMLFRILWDFIGFGLRFLQQDPRRAITDPVQDVVNFISRYEATYGTVHPVFYQGTYGQALNDAKRELKFLLVYLQSDEHSDTPTFCKDVMRNQDFIDLIRENMLFWGCSVSTPEGYRTSQALRENTYPFLALIVLKNHRMTIVARIEGTADPVRVVQRLQQAMADNEAFLVAERQDRLERSMTQTLREQQDAAYMESLKADQEKERRKREESERRRQEELENERLIAEESARREALQKLKSDTKANLQSQPDVSDPDVLRVVIKLPNGTRLERRFRKTDSLKHLYYFVFSNDDAPDSFEIATNFPKRTLPCKPTVDLPEPPTFAEAGLGPKEMVFVYDLES